MVVVAFSFFNIYRYSVLDKSERSKVLSLILHCADISHPAKSWELHSKWTPLLMEEFFRQGDQEKELKRQCSPLCDRNTTLVPESQIGTQTFPILHK